MRYVLGLITENGKFVSKLKILLPINYNGRLKNIRHLG